MGIFRLAQVSSCSGYDRHLRSILEVLTNVPRIHLDLDAMVRQLGFGANAREHEQAGELIAPAHSKM